MKRIEKTIKNSAYAVGSYIFTAVISILIRKVFLQSLPIEFLGYEGLFGNIFALISLADLGIESLILYRLFPAFATDNKESIKQIISVYKTLYKYVGIIILLLGVVLIPFLHLIIREKNIQWSYVYLIYTIQLAGTVCTYFLAYKRIVFHVSQQEYKCTKVDTLTALFFNIIRLAVLITLKSYTLYLLCGLISGLISNIIISNKVDKEFPFLKGKEKVTFEDIKRLEIDTELKYSFIQKVCFVVYGSTDNIIVTYLFGLKMTGLMGNYIMLYTYVTNFLTRVLRPFQMSIGDYIYSVDREKGKQTFKMFDFASFCLACIVCNCYFNTFNPIITLLFGEQYLLDSRFITAFVANQYIMWNHQFLTYYRYAFGKYKLDTIPFFAAAILNIVLSIILGRAIGIAGVMWGTVVGHLGIWIGRTKVVFTEYLKSGIWDYIQKQILRFSICILLLAISRMLCESIAINIYGIVLRLFVSVFVCFIILPLIFLKTTEMKDIFYYIKSMINMVLLRKRR